LKSKHWQTNNKENNKQQNKSKNLDKQNYKFGTVRILLSGFGFYYIIFLLIIITYYYYYFGVIYFFFCIVLYCLFCFEVIYKTRRVLDNIDKNRENISTFIR